MNKEQVTQEMLDGINERISKQEHHIAILEKMLEQVLLKMPQSQEKASVVIHTVNVAWPTDGKN